RSRAIVPHDDRCPSSISHIMQPGPPRSTLFPYTTLFRSRLDARDVAGVRGARDHRRADAGFQRQPDPDAGARHRAAVPAALSRADRKSTRLNSSHVKISYAVFCLKKKRITGLKKMPQTPA